MIIITPASLGRVDAHVFRAALHSLLLLLLFTGLSRVFTGFYRVFLQRETSDAVIGFGAAYNVVVVVAFTGFYRVFVNENPKNTSSFSALIGF